MSSDDYGRMRVPFRFRKPEDIKAYGRPDGDGWWVYDEAEVFELPTARLIELERAMGGYAIPHLLRDFRRDSAEGRHAASWLAIHMADPEIAGPYASYDPRILMVHWDFAAQDGEEPDPLDSEGSTSSLPPD